MAQALIRFLENQYIAFDEKEERFVQGIFMLPGHGNIVGLGQAIEQEAKALKVYQGKNEQGMTHAAVAFAKQKLRKQIYACTTSVGPGAANMIPAAATATANNIPVLLLPGDVYAVRQPDPVLQQIEQIHDLSISTNDAFKAVCRYWDRIVRPEQLMSAMLSAMRVLTDPADTGAVCIAIPQDVQGEAYDYPESFFAKRVHRIERRPAPAYSVKEAVELIAKKKKPLLICGGGVRYSEAAESFASFAESFNIPFGETQAGKSALPFDHPLNLGGIGVTGNSAANEVAKDADLVIGVGTRYTDFTTSSKWLFQNKHVQFVNINVSEFQAYKLDAVKVIADAKEGLDAIQKELTVIGYRSNYNNEISVAKANWEKELKRLSETNYNTAGYTPEVNDDNVKSAQKFFEDIGSCLTQTNALAVINQNIAKDSVVIGSSGSLPGDMQRMWCASKAGTYNMEYGYSCMGYEISGAFGAKLAAEDCEVYAMVGDGSYLMLHSEFITSLQEGKKINVMLFDNASFGCINNLQVSQGNDTLVTELRYRTQSGKHDGKFMHIDYAGCAESYGAKAYRVQTKEELIAALEDAKMQSISTLIDIKVMPKTMTSGYGAWWRVGVAAVSEKEKVKDAYSDLCKNIESAVKY
jgi:3D-(3,5/4)-trihydroxycyclohexane-1,2-dione acylhydrolase (decyclizing)